MKSPVSKKSNPGTEESWEEAALMIKKKGNWKGEEQRTRNTAVA